MAGRRVRGGKGPFTISRCGNHYINARQTRIPPFSNNTPFEGIKSFLIQKRRLFYLGYRGFIRLLDWVLLDSPSLGHQAGALQGVMSSINFINRYDVRATRPSKCCVRGMSTVHELFL